MSDLQQLQGALEKVARRQRWQNGWRGAWQGFLAGSALWLVALAAYKLAPLPIWSLAVAGLLALKGVASGFVLGFWRQPALVDVARRVDRQQHFEERVSTALEFGGAHADSDWGRALLADALKVAGRLDPRRLLPWGLPGAARWTLLLLALGAGLGFVPEYRSKALVQKQREAENIKATGQTLASIAKRTLEARPPALEPTKQNLENVEQLGKQLSQQPLTRTEALRDLSNAAEKLKDELKQLGKDPALKRLEQAARQNGGSMANAESLKQQMEALQKALGNQTATPEKLEELKSKLEQLQKQAAGLPSKDSPNGEQARQELAKSLASMAQQMRDLGQSLNGIEEAIAALAADQTGLLAKGLGDALTDLEKLKQQAQAMQQLQQQAARLGKDLAEQLKNGQAEAATETLTKMVKQLQAANLPPDQLKQIMDEVQKAVDPAGDYGKVKEFLQQAAKQMQQGQKSDASQSLADAAKELQKLMEQMADAESLAATLEALQRAQMAVATGQGMGQCRNPGAGQGGKPGRGVGTWAEEEGWLQVPEITDRWDNSGINRPDQDPRAQTDRGDATLADNLDKTKLRGQLTPGAPMPSITLKGVSIKGQSNVKFEEAAAAAQTDAQNALNQDQVPRAYKNAVREYFDDFKK